MLGGFSRILFIANANLLQSPQHTPIRGYIGGNSFFLRALSPVFGITTKNNVVHDRHIVATVTAFRRPACATIEASESVASHSEPRVQSLRLQHR